MFRLKLHFASKKNNFTIKTRPPNIFFRRNTPEGYPKNRSKLTIEKKTTKHSQCPPPLPPFHPPTCRITARGGERHTTWLKESLKGSGGVKSLGRTEFLEETVSSIDMSKTSKSFRKGSVIFSSNQKKTASKLQNGSSSQKITGVKIYSKKNTHKTTTTPVFRWFLCSPRQIFPSHHRCPPRQVKAPAGVKYIPFKQAVIYIYPKTVGIYFLQKKNKKQLVVYIIHPLIMVLSSWWYHRNTHGDVLKTLRNAVC